MSLHEPLSLPGGAPPRLLALFLVGAASLAPGPARAQHPSIVDRDFSLDLYTGAALGSARIVGMGGAGIAVAEGSAFMNGNAAAAAVRLPASKSGFDWDVHLDWLNPDVGSDFDNNGMKTTELGKTTLITGGGFIQFRDMGVGLAVLSNRTLVTAKAGQELDPTVTVVRLFLGKSLPRDLTLGLGIRIGGLSVGIYEQRRRARELFNMDGGTFEAGLLWKPSMANLRLGLTGAAPVFGDELKVTDCDPANCAGFILPGRVVVPWEVGAGLAYWIGQTPWNRQLEGRFRDERRLLLAADLAVIGRVRGGHGLEAFLNQQLQPSGRSEDLSVRVGAEYEWLPGRLRIRGGSYWEPSRFEETQDRIHLTLGLMVRVYELTLREHLLRLALSLTGDVAAGYGNAGLSLGFWN